MTPDARIVILAAALAAAPLAAHDFWIEPADFRPAAGAEVAVGLRVGEQFAGDPVPRRDARIVAFFADGAGGRVEVTGRDGTEPAGRWRPVEPGLHAIAYQSAGSYLELAAGKFGRYLVEEGLEEALAERRRRGEDELPARERFSRSAKALVAVGGAAGGDRPLGLELELVAEADPYALGSGAALPVRLLLRGRPLAGAQLVARAQGDPQRPQILRTVADGRAAVRLDRPGLWLLKAVHIERTDDDPRAEWHSLWASLTFSLAGR